MGWFSNADLAGLAGRICPVQSLGVPVVAVEFVGRLSRKSANRGFNRGASSLLPVGAVATRELVSNLRLKGQI